MAAVRCPSGDCGWTGNRKTSEARDTELAKACPKCEGRVLVGSPPPSRLETLPSGIEVAFWDETNIETGRPQRRRYRVPGIDGEKLPSISQIAGIFEKQGLVPSAVRLTEEGVIALAESGVNIAALTVAELRALMIERGLHYDSIWGEARDRGRDAHTNLLHLLRDGKVARMSDYPAERRPWIQAGMKCILDLEPEVFDVEYFVASLKHGFAGRGDLFCRPTKAPAEWSQIVGKKTRMDFKTVTEWRYKDNGELREPWDENLIGLAGYDLAAPESGYDESDIRLIVRLGPDGNYAITESHATKDVFLAALLAHTERRFLATGRRESSQR